MLRIIITFFLVVLLIACNRINTNREKDVFRYNEASGISSLDPAFAKDLPNIWACNQIYNGLIQLNDRLISQPCIAKSWTITDSGKKYTFRLRNDVWFHNSPCFNNGKGRKVIASDFVYSFNRLIAEDILSPGAWILNYIKEKPDGLPQIEAINDTILEITLSEPFPPFAALLSMKYCSVVPKEAIKYYGSEFRRNPVGTGPFMLKIWKEGVKMVLVKNPSYFEYENGSRLPKLQAVSISFIADKQAAFLEFVKGKIDFISGIDPSYKDEILNRQGKLNKKYENRFKLVTCPYLNTEYLAFMVDTNNETFEKSPISDLRIRKAISYGIDKVKMIKYLRNNTGYAGINGFVPVSLYYSKKYNIEGYTYQPEMTRKLLEEAGYPGGRGLPPITLTTTSEHLDICKFIQHELSLAGIQLKIDVTPSATLREAKANSKLEFFRSSWIADYPDAENYLSLFYSKNFSPAGPNYTHFTSEVFDKLYTTSLKTVDNDERIRLYYEMDKLIMDKAPVIVLYYDKVLRFSGNNIEGLGINPINLLTLKRVTKK